MTLQEAKEKGLYIHTYDLNRFKYRDENGIWHEVDLTKQEIDHEHTNEITCPYCGHELKESFELLDSGTLDCDECKGTYSFQRHITYSTKKLD